MKIYENGVIREMTPEELHEMEKADRLFKIEESTRPLTTEEVSAMLITSQINNLKVDNNTALRMKQFYPTFDSIVGKEVDAGFKFNHGTSLWETIQPKTTIQAHYPPGPGKESLYTEVCETHEGTIDDPIPYNNNMVLVNGKYYIQNQVIYQCTRDTVNPVYSKLSDLVGVYVEEAT